MRTKVSEKKLVGGIVFLAVGIFLLLKTSIVAAPVLISEKGLLFAVIACCLMLYGLHLLRRSRLKV